MRSPYEWDSASGGRGPKKYGIRFLFFAKRVTTETWLPKLWYATQIGTNSCRLPLSNPALRIEERPRQHCVVILRKSTFDPTRAAKTPQGFDLIAIASNQPDC